MEIGLISLSEKHFVGVHIGEKVFLSEIVPWQSGPFIHRLHGLLEQRRVGGGESRKAQPSPLIIGLSHPCRAISPCLSLIRDLERRFLFKFSLFSQRVNQMHGHRVHHNIIEIETLS